MNGIKDDRFVKESIVYGKDLITHAVQQPQVKDACKQMTIDCLVKEPRVLEASK